MCTDFQRLNHRTENDAIPLPRSGNVEEAVGGAQWFACLELASGYWQMQINEEDRPNTESTTHCAQL